MEIVDRYLRLFPAEAEELKKLQLLLKLDSDPTDRTNYLRGMLGHITASCIVLSPDHRNILLVHNNKIGKDLQPGGHIDGDNLLKAAAREAAEETGVALGRYLQLDGESELVPFDIAPYVFEAHLASEQPEHLHFDFCYGMVAASETLGQVSDSASDPRWCNIEAISEPSVIRLVKKLVQLLPQLTPVAIDSVSALQ